MRILITGSSGFLGSRLAVSFRERGHVVTGTARHPGPEQVRFVLGEDFERSLVSGFDEAIHAAHDFDSAARTLEGTRKLFEAVQQGGATRQLFISSYSARPDAVSEYGQVKYALEQMFLDEGEAVVRPGLVIGNGGIFGRNLRTMITSPVIPLLNDGRDEVPVLSIGDAVRSIVLLVETRRAGAWNLFHPNIPTMRQIVDVVAAETGRRPLIVPVPAGIVLPAVRWAARLGIPLPFREDNIRSLEANRTRLHESGIGGLDIVPEDLREAIRAAVQALHSL
jgi:nucleoside-diphosphate-sugar epimerase